MSYRLKEMLCELIDYTYKENTPTNKIAKYKNFTIEYNNKLSQTDASYSWKNHKITIRNLYRNDIRLKFDAIRCLAHHIDFRNRGVVNSQWEFFAEYERLMRGAVQMGILSILGVQENCELTEKEEKVWFKLMQEGVASGEYKQNLGKVTVINSFDIKDILKNRGYYYSQIEKSWSKDLEIDKIADEVSYLQGITKQENIITKNFDDVSLDSYIWIYVYESFERKDMLKSAGYIYDGKERCWKKKFLACEVRSEISDLNSLGLLTIRTKSA